MPSFENIEQKLLKAGIQPTAQRLAICRYVLFEADHPTAEQVKQWADDHFPKMSLATVYNTLNRLVGAGLLRELRFSLNDKVIYDHNMSVHQHFFDEATGRFFDLDSSRVEVLSHLKPSVQISSVDLLIRGRLDAESRAQLAPLKEKDPMMNNPTKRRRRTL